MQAPPGVGVDPGLQSISDRDYDAGRSVYLRQCADCHGERGQGRPSIAPALAGDRAVTLRSATNLIRIVLFGGFPPGTSLNARPSGMAPYYPFLHDDEIASALTYVRGSWGNAAGPVSALEVSDNRGSPLW